MCTVRDSLEASRATGAPTSAGADLNCCTGLSESARACLAKIYSRQQSSCGSGIIQVGGFEDEKNAKARLDLAQSKAREIQGRAEPFIQPVVKGDKTLFRARFAGLDKAQADAACEILKRSEIPCMALKN